MIGHQTTGGPQDVAYTGMDNSRQPIHGNLMFGCLIFSNRQREPQDVQSASKGLEAKSSDVREVVQL